MVLVESQERVEVLEESRAPPDEQLSPFRRLTVNLNKQSNQSNYGTGVRDHAKVIGINHGNVQNAMEISLKRTIRVPDNKNTNFLPPDCGMFPIYKVQDFAKAFPQDMAQKGGLFFPMYQREAMWISFKASTPFAIKVYVGGVNAVSGLPMTENEKTREKRLRMMRAEKPIQDYMVVPGQKWLDGIVSEDGKVRQFIAKEKGSGYSVEAQVTGEETVGGIQIEIIPVKKDLPAGIDIHYKDEESKVIMRTLNFAEHNITKLSTWLDLKVALQEMFGISTKEQSLGPTPLFRDKLNIDDNMKLGDYCFMPSPVLHLTHGPKAVMVRPSSPSIQPYLLTNTSSPSFGPAPIGSTSAAPKPRPKPILVKYKKEKTASPGLGMAFTAESLGAPAAAKEMGLSAGGLIRQAIIADPRPADTWDVEASITLRVQILDAESFGQVTGGGLAPPRSPIDAVTYARLGLPFFEAWAEENTGISGDFGDVRSAAQIDAAKAAARGEAYEGEEEEEEDSVPQRVVPIGIGRFSSTFRPVEVLKKELEGLRLDGE